MKIKLLRKGVRELLKSAEMMDACQEAATGIATRAGTGFETSSYTGKNRVNISVYPSSAEARRDNLKNNTLMKAIGR